MADLFRKSALERLSSPEQLDKVITVSSPASWLSLLGVTVIIAAAIVWSILGKLPTTVTATGIVLDENETIVCFVPFAYAVAVEQGMNAVIEATDTSSKHSRFGAEVVSADKTAFSMTEMYELLGTDNLLVDYFMSQGPIAKITLCLNGNPPPAGTLFSVKIVTDETAPITKLFTGLKER